ncbi:hypothetical protein SNEBB_002958 [Seison nebaliae]|nr:hypothetical protein SNEBB_002958 [Seison nebaliae]
MATDIGIWMKLKNDKPSARSKNNKEYQEIHRVVPVEFWFSQTNRSTTITYDFDISSELFRTNHQINLLGTKRTTKKKYICGIQKKIGNRFQELDISKLFCLDHKNLIQFYNVYEDELAIKLILSHPPNLHDLLDYIVDIEIYSEQFICKLFRQLIDALEYLHHYDIFSLNLRPESFMIDGNRKLIINDWYTSTINRSLINYQFLNKDNGFATPELLRNEKIGKSDDIWNSGIILYILICGFEPFTILNDKEETFERILQIILQFPEITWNDATEASKNLIQKCLCLETDRISLSQIKNHIWMRKAPTKIIRTKSLPVHIHMEFEGNTLHLANAQVLLKKYRNHRKIKCESMTVEYCDYLVESLRKESQLETELRQENSGVTSTNDNNLEHNSNSKENQTDFLEEDK